MGEQAINGKKAVQIVGAWTKTDLSEEAISKNPRLAASLAEYARKFEKGEFNNSSYTPQFRNVVAKFYQTVRGYKAVQERMAANGLRSHGRPASGNGSVQLREDKITVRPNRRAVMKDAQCFGAVALLDPKCSSKK